MSVPILATKLYIPPPRPRDVLRHRLSERMNEGLHRKLTLISAPAGFGKTTLVSEWVAGCGQSELKIRTAWLSLDEGDSDPPRFLTGFIAALQTIAPIFGQGVLGVLQSPQPPSTEAILTTLLNEITIIPDNFVLVLDDYHVIDSKAVDTALTVLIEHMPSQMHLVIVTREDPQIPLARLRVRDELIELRVADLRFTLGEATRFLTQVMGLDLSSQDIAALETRTEGWIAGLQLASLALKGTMRGHKDATGFIKSFTGSHHFVMDYLVEQVLQQQPERIQTFLLRTSILDRLCGPLCDALLLDPTASGQETLEYIQHANLFIIPLDNERRWYRYHHLFADLLRQRLQQSTGSSRKDAGSSVNELHIRASQWYENNGFELEAFQHAAAANDIERAERLSTGKGIPLHFRGAATAVLDWLASLPKTVMDARPYLWWRYASLLLVTGQTIGVEEKLQAAEAAVQSTALQGAELDDKTRNLVGQIASARATLALTRYDVESMFVQSRRALEYLDPDRLFSRATANWVLGFAYFLQGDRGAAGRILAHAVSLSQASGNIFTMILGTIGVGTIHEVQNELHQAAETYRHVLQLTGDQPLQIVSEAHLGLARVLYEWNDLDAAEEHARKGLELSRQYERIIDRFIYGEVLLARIKLARGDVDGAAAMLAQTSQTARQKNFVFRIPEVAAAQVPVLLRQGNLAAAAHLAQTYNLPMSQARVHLAQGDPSAALAGLEPLRQQAEGKDWQDERLKMMVLQAVALHAQGENDEAVQVLGDALALAEPGGFLRIFVDEGAPMAELLTRMKAEGGRMNEYVDKLLAAFRKHKDLQPSSLIPHPLIEPLSQRELQVLQLVAQGLSNREISEQLSLALITVKGHNQKIFGKLQVSRRTEAVARARELGLL